MNELTLPWLHAHEPFPDPESACSADSPWPGLLAAGGVLDAPTLVAAYSQGIFPWYGPDEPLLWWSTDPRMVLRPQHFRLHHSLRKTLCRFRQNPQACIRIDSAFDEVLQQCATAPRQGQNGSWITPDIMRSYGELHRLGLAHSVETWVNGRLVGGLYLVALGRAVFGESMFTRQTDASKIALAALVCLCRAHDVELIDCQQQTAHLASLGAQPIARADFLASIRRTQQTPAMRWQFEAALWTQLLPQQPEQ
ncbi:MAG: leucyl/phenylalanyl-tRNA--protein transferase [Brachymonas sp.]|nr:leucyl/phenylalanyl-tRNA--protein transferase [Brachymonas sp.]